MASSNGKPNYSRRLSWLAVFIVLLFGGYSAVWYYVAGALEKFTATAITEFNKDGSKADCAKATARGFPFRIGLFCDNVRFEDPSQGVTVSAQAFRSAAQVYDPFHIVAELDSPAVISAPQLGDLGFNWKNLRASARLTTDFPQAASVETDELSAAGNDATSALLRVKHAEGHMRQNGADLDLAGSFVDVAPDARLTKGMTLPPLSGEVDLTIKDGINFVRYGTGSLRGQSGTIRTLALTTGGTAGVTVAGPFSVSDEGLVDATFTVTVRNPKELSAQLVQMFPDKASQIQTGFAGLAVLGANPTVPLNIKGGSMTLGFIPLGKLPPL